MRAYLLAGVAALMLSGAASAQTINAPQNGLGVNDSENTINAPRGGDANQAQGQGQGQLQGQLQGQAQGQGQDQGQQQAAVSIAGAASRSDSASSSTSSVSGVAATVSGVESQSRSSSDLANNASQSVTVQGDNYQRAPVSTAFAVGAAGVGEGMCRFGPGVGYQGITGGATLSLPIFSDKLCKQLAADGANIRKAAAIAAIAGNEAAVQWLSAKDADVNAAVTLARKNAALAAGAQ